MRLRYGLAALSAVASLTALPVFADQHGHAATPHASAPTTVQHPAVTTAAHGRANTAKAPSASTPHGKATTTKSVTGAKSTSKSSVKHSSATTPTTAGTSGSTTTATRSNPIAQKIAAHPQLASKLLKMLPSGISLAAASNGFKNQGQFIAALHVSKNLNIPFRQLKMAMTGAHPASLGQTIQQLRPERGAADAGTQVAHAEQQASDDVAATTATSTTTATTQKPHKTKARKG